MLRFCGDVNGSGGSVGVGGMLWDYSEVIVSCSQHGVQSGQDSEKDTRLGIIWGALKP